MGSLFCVLRDMVKYNPVEFIISCGDARVVILGDCFDTQSEVLVWVKKKQKVGAYIKSSCQSKKFGFHVLNWP